MTNLRCTYCGTEYDADTLQTLCPKDGRVLAPQYDLKRAANTMTKEALGERPATMWRYTEIMPARDPEHVVTLGEGWTPLATMDGLGPLYGLVAHLGEGRKPQPDRQFQRSGPRRAITRARELGVTAVAIPSAGNAASAMSAFAARAGMDAFVFMPQDTPDAMKAESAAYGANVLLVNGLINDCGAIIKQQSGPRGWFDVSTLKEPYRPRAKRRSGSNSPSNSAGASRYHHLPDRRRHRHRRDVEGVRRTGSDGADRLRRGQRWCGPGTRVCANRSRFRERRAPCRALGERPTVAPGMRVPIAVGDYLILDAVRESGGTCVTVTDNAMVEWMPKICGGDRHLALPELRALSSRRGNCAKVDG